MRYSYVIIDDNPESILKTLAVANRFRSLDFVGSASNYDEGLNLILEHQPKLIFLEIDPSEKQSNLKLSLINELYRFLKVVPKIIITTTNKDLVFEAIKYEVLDYLIKPLDGNDLRKTILKIEKISADEVQSQLNSKLENQHFEITLAEEIIPSTTTEELQTSQEVSQTDHTETEGYEIASSDGESDEKKERVSLPAKQESKEDKPLIICVKSYGDYRFIEAKDICYLQADNNSTDLHLINGEMVTAFKTLKHFENVLSNPFVRIHNSYIVNIDYVSRIHTGNSVCYIKNTTTKLPFSKSYKENVDAILNSITNGNYLEI